MTGATGFIGRNAPVELASRGYEVHAVSCSEAPPAIRGVEVWHRANLLEPEAAARFMELVKPTKLLHLAWYVEPGRFWQSSENVRWLEASLRLLRAFTEAGGRRAVMAGTCAEYDWSQSGRRSEGSVLGPTTLYGISKDALRVVSAAWCARHEVEFAWGRIFFLSFRRSDGQYLPPSWRAGSGTGSLV